MLRTRVSEVNWLFEYKSRILDKFKEYPNTGNYLMYLIYFLCKPLPISVMNMQTL